MAHNSSHNSARNVQPPFQLLVEDTCSIICEDVPVNCTIRVGPVEGRSPPRVSPASQWIEDYGPPPPRIKPGRNVGFRDEPPQDDYGPLVRDKYGKIIGSPISSPPLPMRSKRSMADSVRRNIQENLARPGPRGMHKSGVEEDIFSFRKPHSKNQSRYPSPSQERTSAGSQASSSNEQLPPPTASGATDRLLNPQRPQRDFRRTNIMVDGADLREMHSNPGPAPQNSSSYHPANPTGERSPWASPSPPPPPSNASRGNRCCGMADYNPANYRSKTPERDAGRDGAGGHCTYHGSQPCPAQAGARCRQNCGGQDGDAKGSGSRSLRRERSCKYHDSLPCPVLAGVPCRGEIQLSGASSPSSSRSQSPSPSSPSSPTYRPGSPSRIRGGASPPLTIAPPPKSPRSRSPARQAPSKGKGACM